MEESTLLSRIRSKSPAEVYVVALVYWILLFLDIGGPFQHRSSEFTDLFHFHNSIMSDMITAIAKDGMGRDNQKSLYWIVSATYVLIIWLKARKISAWMWDR